MDTVRLSMQDIVSGADLEKYTIFFYQTWLKDRSSGELVLFDSLGFSKNLILEFQ